MLIYDCRASLRMEKLICGVIGLEFNSGEVHGKMVFLELIVQFLPSGTGLTSFKLRIR